MTTPRWTPAALVLAATVVPAWAQTPTPAPVVPTEATTTEIAGVVRGGLKVQILKQGLTGTEGPIALADGGFRGTPVRTALQLSLDERTLYVANTPGEFVYAFDRKEDGSISGMRPIARLKGPTRPDGTGVRGGADGLAVDTAGRLYVATTVGVQVFSSSGEALGTIPIGLSNGPQNLAFGGPDKKTLFVVGRGAVFAIPMEAQGHLARAK